MSDIEKTTDSIEEVDALRYEVRQLRRALAELNLKHEGLMLEVHSKDLVTKYAVAQGDEVDVAARVIRRAAK